MPEIVLYLRCPHCKEIISLRDSTMEEEPKTLRRMPATIWKAWTLCPFCSCGFTAKSADIQRIMPHVASRPRLRPIDAYYRLHLQCSQSNCSSCCELVIPSTCYLSDSGMVERLDKFLRWEARKPLEERSSEILACSNGHQATAGMSFISAARVSSLF